MLSLDLHGKWTVKFTVVKKVPVLVEFTTFCIPVTELLVNISVKVMLTFIVLCLPVPLLKSNFISQNYLGQSVFSRVFLQLWGQARQFHGPLVCCKPILLPRRVSKSEWQSVQRDPVKTFIIAVIDFQKEWGNSPHRGREKTPSKVDHICEIRNTLGLNGHQECLVL